MFVRFLATKAIPTAMVGVAVTHYCSSAQGFFPPVPIGSGEVITPPPVSPVVPVVPPPPVVPPVSPPPFVPPPVTPRPPITPDDCDPPPPCGVPEPATVVSGLIGLGVLGAAAARKKIGKKA
jgi:hypothetical protein